MDLPLPKKKIGEAKKNIYIYIYFDPPIEFFLSSWQW